jgi:hypothetical protein
MTDVQRRPLSYVIVTSASPDKRTCLNKRTICFANLRSSQGMQYTAR